MVYIGYPIRLSTAFDIFGYPYNEDTDVNHLYNMLKVHLATYDLNLYFYDKNVYILGMVIHEFHATNDTHFTVNDATELMIVYKHKVMQSLKVAGANLSDFDIEVMEGTPSRVKNPPPYVIS
jgi:hypothetical protein